MLDLDLSELRNTYLSAKASAELLRRSGETAKAERVESLARIAARELEKKAHRMDPPSGGSGLNGHA